MTSILCKKTDSFSAKNEMSELTQPETVFTVTDFYDGPLKGVANFMGQPHAFELVFSEEQDDFDRDDDGFGLYRLAPIDPEAFALVLDEWSIWLRWQKAFKSGKTTIESHPALPEDRVLYQAMKARLSGRLNVEDPQAIKMRGKFGRFRPPEKADEDNYKVIWKKEV
jgi:hypothetical protein